VRIPEWTFMKTDTEEVYKKLSASLFSLNWKTYAHFCSYLVKYLPEGKMFE
jgi:regulator of sigma D